MGVKRQQGGADQGDLLDEALKAALRHGATGEGGTGPEACEEPQASAAWDHERALTRQLMEEVIGSENLNRAYKRVKANGGAAGVDGMPVTELRAWIAINRDQLIASLLDGSYRPQPVRGVQIPKPGGGMRRLGIPTVVDRLVKQAITQVLEPRLDPTFSGSSFGFRPGRSAHDALRQARGYVADGYETVVDLDLEKFFDSIPHDRLMALVEGSISDGRVLSLIESLLHQDIMTKTTRWQPDGGTPQGAVLSPLLANLYLHPLDLLMEQSGYRMVRYADDFVILCASEAEAAAALRQVTAWVAANGPTLHPDKTKVCDSRQPGQGFDFLGYRFEAGVRFVRAKSLKAFKDKLRARTVRSRGDSLQQIVADLNSMLRGWSEYFKHARPRLFRRLDGLIRRRLRAILRKQEKRPSMGRSEADHRRWTNAFFAGHGLFALQAAHAAARRSR